MATKVKHERRPCISCGRKVRDAQPYPWPGHAKTCKLVNEWRAAHRTEGEK